MFKIALVIVASLLALSLGITVTQAQTRVFVGISGNDSNPCTVSAPCRTFQRAHDVVAANGEIDVLDPAGYGTLTITKSISVQGHGYSGITATAGADAVTINASANSSINIRGLIVEGAGTGSMGITLNSGGTLQVQDTAVRNFVNNGINFVPTTQSALIVSNTVVADNGVHGIAMKPNNGGSVIFTGTFVRVEANNNGTSGIAVIGDLASTQSFRGVNAIAIDCVVTGKNYASTSTGFLATSSQGITIFKLFRSTAVGNFVGASAVSTNNAVVAIGLSQSHMELNRGTASASGTNASVQSYGNNFTNGQAIAGSTIPTD